MFARRETGAIEFSVVFTRDTPYLRCLTRFRILDELNSRRYREKSSAASERNRVTDGVLTRGLLESHNPSKSVAGV